MATYKLVTSRFPDGATVYANPVDARHTPPAAGVVTSGSITFQGLREIEEYVAHASVSGVYLEERFTTGDGSATNPYLAIYFGGDEATKGQQLFLAHSTDATTFTPHAGPISTGAAQSRDQDVIYYAGRYWLAYTKTPAFNTVSTGFGLSVSDDLVSWSALADVSFSAVSGVKRVWGPCWYLDDDGPRVFVAITTTDSDQGPFKMYEIHPTNGSMTAWSSPVNVSSGLPTSVFDFTVRKVGSTWVALYKNNVTEFIERATSTSRLGPWTVTHTGDWMGHAAALGTSPPAAEGTHIETLPGGSTRMWFDRYRIPGSPDAGEGSNNFGAAREYYSDTTDPTLASGWSAPTVSNTLGRHARVRQMPLPDAFTSSPVTSHLELARLATYHVPVGDFFTPITWDHVDEDTDGMFDVSLDATTVIVRHGGLWTITFNAVFLSVATGNVFTGIMFNGSYDPGVTEKRPGAGYDPAVVLAMTRRLRRGDKIQVCVAADAARDLGTVPPPRLRVTRVGP